MHHFPQDGLGLLPDFNSIISMSILLAIIPDSINNGHNKMGVSTYKKCIIRYERVVISVQQSYRGVSFSPMQISMTSQFLSGYITN